LSASVTPAIPGAAARSSRTRRTTASNRAWLIPLALCSFADRYRSSGTPISWSSTCQDMRLANKVSAGNMTVTAICVTMSTLQTPPNLGPPPPAVASRSREETAFVIFSAGRTPVTAVAKSARPMP
jgi:hypothetical protein